METEQGYQVTVMIRGGILCEGCGFYLGTCTGTPRFCEDCIREGNKYGEVINGTDGNNT